MSADVVALVPAAGYGTRLGLGPKAFLELDGQTLIEYVVRTLQPCVDRILVALPPSHTDLTPEAVRDLAEVYPGQVTRHATVRALLDRCHESIVVIHDVTRPFASRELIGNVIAGAVTHGAAAAFVKTHIPVVRWQDGFAVESLPRDQLRLSQTPLAFRRELLAECYRLAEETGVETQATFELALMSGQHVFCVEGEELNLKIATQFEWEVARRVGWPAIRSKTADAGSGFLELP